MKKIILTAAALIALSTTAHADVRFDKYEDLANGKGSYALVSKNNKQWMTVRYTSDPKKRPASAEEFFTHSVTISNGDNFICPDSNLDHTKISVYYKIDNGPVGYNQAWVSKNNKVVTFGLSNRYTKEERPHRVSYSPKYGGGNYAFDMKSFIDEVKAGNQITFQTVDGCGQNMTFVLDLKGAKSVIEQEETQGFN